MSHSGTPWVLSLGKFKVFPWCSHLGHPDELTQNLGLVGRVAEGCQVLAMLESELRRVETRVTEGLGTRLGELKMGGEKQLSLV